MALWTFWNYEAAYRTVQQIYYPGFTIGGIAEPVSILALGLLLYLTPYASGRFWWTAAALVLMIAVHGTYWLMTHPVNRFWVEGVELSGAGSSFFSTFSGDGGARHWTQLRNTWEISHVIRAGLAMLALLAVATVTSRFEKDRDLTGDAGQPNLADISASGPKETDET